MGVVTTDTMIMNANETSCNANAEQATHVKKNDGGLNISSDMNASYTQAVNEIMRSIVLPSTCVQADFYVKGK